MFREIRAMSSAFSGRLGGHGAHGILTAQAPRQRSYCRDVTEGAAPGGERVRAAEVIAALCLATDLGMGFPLEHGLHSTLVAMRLADRLGVEPETASQTYYACLLSYAGCTADAEIAAELFGGGTTTHFVPAIFGSPSQMMTGIMRSLPDPARAAPVRVAQIARRLPKAARTSKAHLAALCEVAQMLTERLGLPAKVQSLFPLLTERWDGKSQLRRAQGDEIPLSLRITHVARDAAFQRLLGGEEYAARIVRERAGHAFDPAIATLLADEAHDLLTLDAADSAWEETLRGEPFPHLILEGERIDRALAAMGDFADLASPYLVGHSAGVAELAAASAERCRLEPGELVTVRRAAVVQDVGRVAVPARIWQKPGPLTADEWEQVRLHAYYSERVLSHSPFLSALTSSAGRHHERLDGSGYHRGATAATLSPAARLLAAADAYHAMTEPRPHRAALPAEQAAAILGDEARAGRLDADAVAAVLACAGQRVPSIERPAGLTEREAEVVGLLARGLQTKQIARALGISAKTADHHVQSAYGKMGVSTRAAAALFAMEHGLVAWGELPIGGATGRS
jgi:HD-GYP domain-containing protein (c-di-GMP phosphodiesterase class II)